MLPRFTITNFFPTEINSREFARSAIFPKSFRALSGRRTKQGQFWTRFWSRNFCDIFFAHLQKKKERKREWKEEATLQSVCPVHKIKSFSSRSVTGRALRTRQQGTPGRASLNIQRSTLAKACNNLGSTGPWKALTDRIGITYSAGLRCGGSPIAIGNARTRTVLRRQELGYAVVFTAVSRRST